MDLKQYKEDEAEGGNIDFDCLSELPSRLHEVCLKNFTQSFPDYENWSESKRLVALICAAQEPLPTSLLVHIMGEEFFREQSLRISSIFPVSRNGASNRIRPIHNSVTDWIVGKTSSAADGTDDAKTTERHDFFISTEEIDDAHASLGRACLDLLASSRDGSYEGHDEEMIVLYATKHLVVHVCRGGVNEELDRVRDELLLSFGWLSWKVTEVGPNETIQDCATFLKAREGSSDRPVLLIKHALQLSLPALSKDPRELASQFVGGRLAMRYEEEMPPEILKLVEEAKTYQPWYGEDNGDDPDEGTALRCWMPTTSCLESAGNQMLDVEESNGDANSVSPRKKIVSGSDDETVRSSNVLGGHTDTVNAVSWSPDGTKIASGSSDMTVRIWDVETGRCCNLLEGHIDGVNLVHWSPDGRHIASGSYDNTVRIWEVETWRCSVEHSDVVNAVRWNPSGTKIACGSWDRTVKIWDVETRKFCNVLRGHSDEIFSVSWSHDGERIRTSDFDDEVRIWDAKTGECIDEGEDDDFSEGFLIDSDKASPFPEGHISFSVDGDTNPKAHFYGTNNKNDSSCWVGACVLDRDHKLIHILRAV